MLRNVRHVSRTLLAWAGLVVHLGRGSLAAHKWTIYNFSVKTGWTLAGVAWLGCIGIPTRSFSQYRFAGAPPQASPDSGELPKLERPSGPYGVGRVGYHWIDSKRPDRFAADSQ